MTRPRSIEELANQIDADQAKLFTAKMFAACGADADWGSDHLEALMRYLHEVQLPEGIKLPEDSSEVAAIEYWLSIDGDSLL